MKKRIGGILIVSGAILLLNPTLDVQTADGRHGNDAGQLLAGIADRSGPGAAERRQEKTKQNTPLAFDVFPQKMEKGRQRNSTGNHKEEIEDA